MEYKYGLIVNVYRSGRDCTNGGLSGQFDNLTLVGKGIDGPFEPAEDRPAFMLVPGPYDTVRAVMAYYDEEAGNYKPVENPPGETGPMFGGNFIYTSDSRFPSNTPIKVFDRYESYELYERLSA